MCGSPIQQCFVYFSRGLHRCVTIFTQTIANYTHCSVPALGFFFPPHLSRCFGDDSIRVYGTGLLFLMIAWNFTDSLNSDLFHPSYLDDYLGCLKYFSILMLWFTYIFFVCVCVHALYVYTCVNIPWVHIPGSGVARLKGVRLCNFESFSQSFLQGSGNSSHCQWQCMPVPVPQGLHPPLAQCIVRHFCLC